MHSHDAASKFVSFQVFMLRQLHSAGHGARAKLQASFGKLVCSTSLPVLLRLFSALVAPAISYGCEVWGSQCHGKLVSDAKKLQGVQLPFCAMCVVACLSSLRILQLQSLLSWLKTHAVSNGGCS